jgi:BlaI family transcriptional regulator, penicillinase repressor
MRKPRPTLTPHELAVMKIVWRRGQATVRDVYETLRERRRVAYTTVMTVMNVLEEKGHLEKTKADRAYVYRPTRPQQQVVGQMVTDFVDRVFDGAAAGLFLHLVKGKQLSKAERERIRRAIEEMEE